MNITDCLFSDTIDLGNGGSYLSVSPSGFSLSPTKPEGELFDGLEEVFDKQTWELGQSLQGRSVKQIKNFTANIAYAIEKRNRTLGQGWSRPPELYLAPLVAYFALSSFGLASPEIVGLILLVGLVALVGKVATDRLQMPATEKDRQRADQLYKKLRALAQIGLSSTTIETQLLKGRDRALLDQRWKTIFYRSTVGVIQYQRTDFQRSKQVYREYLDFRREMLDKNYFVVSHAANQMGAVLTDLLTQLAGRLDQTAVGSAHYKCLRLQKGEIPDRERNADAFLKHVGLVDDHVWSDELLSTSINPFDCRYAESAAHFFIKDSNILTNFGDIALRVISKTLPIKETPKVKAVLNEGFKRIQELLYPTTTNLQKLRELFKGKKSLPGRLYAICLPQERVKDSERNPMYLSKGDGEAVSPDASVVIPALSQNWQSDAYSQGRILTAHLRPENGIKIRAFDGNGEETQKTLQSMINELVEELLPLVSVSSQTQR